MKKIVQKVVSAALVLSLCAGLGGALAYTTPDFSDVPAGNWAYEAIMELSDAGIIKGTGGNTYSPAAEVSTAMFLTLVGRAAFEERAQAVAQPGDSWYDPYVRAAQKANILAGRGEYSALGDLDVGITRYDMAVILCNVMACLFDLQPTRSSDPINAEIADFATIPTIYQWEVTNVYRWGLITGDGAGNFGGERTMRRDEVAVVLSRLYALQESLRTGEYYGEVRERIGETIHYAGSGRVYYDTPTAFDVSLSGATVTLYYRDGRALGSAVTGEDGRYTFDINIDLADYEENREAYYLTVHGVDPDTGIELHRIGDAYLDSLQGLDNGNYFVD